VLAGEVMALTSLLGQDASSGLLHG